MFEHLLNPLWLWEDAELGLDLFLLSVVATFANDVGEIGVATAVPSENLRRELALNHD
jgi:hypothetical protein